MAFFLQSTRDTSTPQGKSNLDLNTPVGISREQDRRSLDLLSKLNEKHKDSRFDKGELEARMESYELAYRMQSEVPDLLDIVAKSKQPLNLMA